MNATLYIVGTGPGDPDLLTLKAVHILNSCPVIISPRGSLNGTSTALDIVSHVVSMKGKEVHELHFPMKKIRIGHEPDPEVLVAWRHAAETVISSIDRGEDVCFPTLGDPAIYSTGYYLYETICGIRPDINTEFVPGVSAMSSCSASLCSPICLGDEMVAIIPATFSDKRIKAVLEQFDTVILMKVHKVLDRLSPLVLECGLIEQAVLVERAGMKDEKVFQRIDQITKQPHYYSTIIIRKNLSNVRVLMN
jgi:precorrin-2/cobalt-factor-2 C20-methyltransferase